MSTELTPLGSLINGWPAKAPEDGPGLVFCDDDTLRALGLEGDDFALVKEVRRHMRFASQAKGSSTSLNNAPAVVRALDTGDLRPYEGSWLTIVLDAQRRRVFAPVRAAAGTSRTVLHISKWVPDEDVKLPVLPAGGCYLLLWGGSVEVLAIENVRARLRDFAAAHPVADVVFRQRSRKASSGSGDSIYAPTTWSLREGTGECSAQAVPFPESTHHEEVNLWKS